MAQTKALWQLLSTDAKQGYKVYITWWSGPEQRHHLPQWQKETLYKCYCMQSSFNNLDHFEQLLLEPNQSPTTYQLQITISKKISTET